MKPSKLMCPWKFLKHIPQTSPQYVVLAQSQEKEKLSAITVVFKKLPPLLKLIAFILLLHLFFFLNDVLRCKFCS